MFRGTFAYRIDPKGRLPVPAPFRRALDKAGEAGLVITLHDRCLAVYGESQWGRLEQQLLSLPPFAKATSALKRRFASQAAEARLDVQGRILLPAPLRKAAGLASEVTVVGVLDRFEIWSPDAWTEALRESEGLLDDATLSSAWPSPPSTGKT
jgi:transcriptional regulator MraZ